MSAFYVTGPFTPWWDVEKYGYGASCERCGARMVRPEDQRAGWLCLSCDNWIPDAEAQ